jgi:hypothetical protein
MNVPGWVGPTVAISLVIVALSFLAIGAVVLSIGLALRKHSQNVIRQVDVISDEARAITRRLKGELEGIADLSADARSRLRAALDSADSRLKDLDALVEVVQSEAEETALDVAAMMRTVRRSGSILGMAKRTLQRRKAHRS